MIELIIIAVGVILLLIGLQKLGGLIENDIRRSNDLGFKDGFKNGFYVGYKAHEDGITRDRIIEIDGRLKILPKGSE